MPWPGRVLHSFGLGFWLCVALAGGFEQSVGGPDVGFGWLEDRVALGFPHSPGRAFVLPVGVLGGDHDVLPGLDFLAEDAPLVLQFGQPARLNRGFPRCLRLGRLQRDRKSTRLNSSHVAISYAVFCLKKKRSTTSCFLFLRTTNVLCN